MENTEQLLDTKQLVALIAKLKKEAGDESLVVNFADPNHGSGYSYATLSQPEVLAALKRANINTIVVEDAGADKAIEIYNNIKKKVAKNPHYSLDNLANDTKLNPKINKAVKSAYTFLLNAAKENMELVFPDNAYVQGSAGEISNTSKKVVAFINDNAYNSTSERPECTAIVMQGVLEKIPADILRAFNNETDSKRTGDNAPSNKPVIDAINEKTKARKNVAVVYGAAHFESEKDINDGAKAKYKPVILIATNDDLRLFAESYGKIKQFPEYRYNPETGDVSKFNLEQVLVAQNEKRDPKKLTDEDCKNLIPMDLKFENYKPEKKPAEPIVPLYIPNVPPSVPSPNRVP